MKAVVAAFNQEKALVGAFSVITNLRMELFEALVCSVPTHLLPTRGKYVSIKRSIRIVTIIYFVTKQIFSLNSCKAPIKTLLAIRAVVFCPLETMDISVIYVRNLFSATLPPSTPGAAATSSAPSLEGNGISSFPAPSQGQPLQPDFTHFLPGPHIPDSPRVQAAGGWRGRR